MCPVVLIVFMLYVFSWIFVFLVAANCSFDALGNIFLYICNDIMFPSLPVSTLYGTVIMTALFHEAF